MHGDLRQEFCQRALQLAESDKRYDIAVRTIDIRIETDVPEIRARSTDNCARRYVRIFHRTVVMPARRDTPVSSLTTTRTCRYSDACTNHRNLSSKTC